MFQEADLEASRLSTQLSASTSYEYQGGDKISFVSYTPGAYHPNALGALMVLALPIGSKQPALRAPPSFAQPGEALLARLALDSH